MARPKILVVDDDMNLRKIICLFLRNADYEPLEAKNGKEGVEIAKQESPDLIVLDVMMPVMDGYSACQIIRSTPSISSIPVIMCTARNRKEDIVAAIKAGANDYLVKPFTRDGLLTKIKKVLTPVLAKAGAEARFREKRAAPRRVSEWYASWGIQKDVGLQEVFKSKVLNISPVGAALEFRRCQICTGYEKDSVHRQCILAPYAEHFSNSKELDFALYVSKDMILEAKGKVIHIYQPQQTPLTEVIGVKFTLLSPEARRVLERYVQDLLEISR
jgi:DNA-binding response OmpR family regulator